MIEIKDGSLITEGKQVFRSLSFGIGKGRVVGVKSSLPGSATMLMECFVGLRGLDEGFVSVNGEPLLPSTARLFRPQISYIPRRVRMPIETVGELFDTVMGLSVNSGIERLKKKLLAEWRRMGLGTELYDAKTDDVDDCSLLLMMLGLANVTARPVILIDFPALPEDCQRLDYIISYIRAMARDNRAIMAANVDGRTMPVCDEVIDLDVHSAPAPTG